MQFNKGEHGFDNQVMDMKPFFRAVGPDFQKDLVVGPFETINVYPLMCHLLGINPEINDGHLDNTKQMLLPKKNTEGNNSTGKFCAIEIKDEAPFLNGNWTDLHSIKLLGPIPIPSNDCLLV